ncbi:MAG: hypothetical protein ACI4OI_05135 [Gemmiger sp.]
MNKQWLRAGKACLPWLVLLALLWAMAIPRGWMEMADISYNITDGDFQNFNPVRRMLAGQIPYRDFTVYLGAGELYSVGAVLLCIGCTFANSVFAAGALTWFCYELLILAVGVAVFGPGRPARIFTLGVSGWYFLAMTGSPVPLRGQILGVLGLSTSVGNSARMIRFSVVALMVLLVAAGLRLWQSNGERPLFGQATGILPRLRAALRWPLHPAVLVPLVVGALVPWSNDAGGAAYIAASLAYGLYLIRHYQKDVVSIARGTLGYIAVSVVGLGASVMVISWGHPLAWWRQTRGVSSMQVWYFNSDPDVRLCYLTDFLPSRWLFCMLALALLFAVLLFTAKTTTGAVRAGGCLGLCLGAALWEIIYALGSGVRGGPSEGGQMIFGLLVPAAAAWGLLQLLRRVGVPVLLRRTISAAAAALTLWAAVTQMHAQQVQTEAIQAELTWQPELGGYLGDQAEKLAAEKALLGGEAVFSTYAGGIETVTGQFQPTGTDYIIHALGDRQRLAYLLAFQNGDFTYAAIPSPKVTLYERWARNANWWFYRDLYRFWQPAGSTTYCGGMHLLWERRGDGNLPMASSISLEQTAPNRVLLTVTAGDPSFCGVADVALSYHVGVSGHPLHSYLHMNCITENTLWEQRGKLGSANYFLPAGRTAAQIPVTIADGVGVVEMTAYPEAAATLTVSGASVEATTMDWEYFFE